MQTTKKIKIVTVDDHPILREGIASIIHGEKDMVVVGEASNGREAIEIFHTQRPDVTLMDLQMQGLNGIDAITTIRREYPQARIIVLTTYEGDVLARRALRAGAAGYILKDMIRTELLEAIRLVHVGKRYIPQRIAAELSISEATVKAHMQNILLKLGASDRTHAVNIAMTRGFLM